MMNDCQSFILILGDFSCRLSALFNGKIPQAPFKGAGTTS